MKPTKFPARENKNEARKAKKRGGDKAKSKSQDCCVTFKPKNPKLLLSAHNRTSQAKIVHLDQKAAKCTTVTRKPLDLPQNAFFGKISRGEWVK